MWAMQLLLPVRAAKGEGEGEVEGGGGGLPPMQEGGGDTNPPCRPKRPILVHMSGLAAIQRCTCHHNPHTHI